MSSLFEHPSFQTQRDGYTHLSYELPHRVHCAVHYPVESPNGSSIILYGHATGISILWRGGLRPKTVSESQSLHGSHTRVDSFTGEDGMVMVDSGEDLLDPSKNQTSSQGPDSGWEESDDAEEYAPVVAHAEISMGTAVFHVAVPSLPADAATCERDTIPGLLSRKLVAAVACADRSTHVISFPLKPLHPAISFLSATAPENYKFEDVVVTGPNSHRSPPRKVALSFTSSRKSPKRTQNLASIGKDSSILDDDPWNLLIASHSAEPCGLLIIFKIPIVEINGIAQINGEFVEKSSTLNLPTPAISLEFNPARYPSLQHTQLLISDTSGMVRILKTLPSASADGAKVPTSIANRHEWLLTLFSPFQGASRAQPGLSSAPSSRCRILDAEWVLNGKGVICLYGDGRWGLWDIEAAGPVPQANGTGATHPSTVISGGGITKFALHGLVGHHQESASSKTSKKSTEGKNLAPMTPNTRKVKQESLFSRSNQGLKTSSLIQGGISLSSASGSASRASHDDSILIWYGVDVFVIPSLMSYWQRAMGSNSSVSSGGSTYGPSPLQLGSISTLGERITSIVQFPHEAASSPKPSVCQMQHDILVSAEHRLVFLCPPRPREQHIREMKTLAERNSGVEPGVRDIEIMEESLDAKKRAGDLTVAEIDRELNRLGNSMPDMRQGLFDDEPRPRHVGFAAGTRR